MSTGDKITSNLQQAVLAAHGFPRSAPEYQFQPGRRWRFDHAWPEAMVAIELEGGVFIRGRHLRPKGYSRDCEKYNTAQLAGWRVFRLTTDQFERGEFLADIAKLVRCDQEPPRGYPT